MIYLLLQLRRLTAGKRIGRKHGGHEHTYIDHTRFVLVYGQTAGLLLEVMDFYDNAMYVMIPSLPQSTTDCTVASCPQPTCKPTSLFVPNFHYALTLRSD